MKKLTLSLLLVRWSASEARRLWRTRSRRTATTTSAGRLCVVLWLCCGKDSHPGGAAAHPSFSLACLSGCVLSPAEEAVCGSPGQGGCRPGQTQGYIRVSCRVTLMVIHSLPLQAATVPPLIQFYVSAWWPCCDWAAVQAP